MAEITRIVLLMEAPGIGWVGQASLSIPFPSPTLAAHVFAPSGPADVAATMVVGIAAGTMSKGPVGGAHQPRLRFQSQTTAQKRSPSRARQAATTARPAATASRLTTEAPRLNQQPPRRPARRVPQTSPTAPPG